MKEKERKSSKLIIGIILVAVGVALLVWAISGKRADAPAHTEGSHDHSSHGHKESAQSDAETSGDSVTITFTDSGFEPSKLTVTKGTTVKVVNNSSRNVQFSSDSHPTHRNNPEMNLSQLAHGESASFVAETVGEHGFHDHIDARMTGTLKVTE